MRLPAINIDGRAAYCRVRSHAPFDCRSVDERFERRSGLPISLDGIVEFVGQKIIAADHGDDLAGLGVECHHRALYPRNLIQLDLQTTGLLIHLSDDELREVPGLKLVARLALAPAHVRAVDGRGVITKTDGGFVFALIDFGDQAHQVTSRRVIVAVPVGIFVAGQFL